MDQCSWHDTPPAFSVDLTNRSGRALRLELVVQNVLALTDQRFGDIFTKVAMSCTIRMCRSAEVNYLRSTRPYPFVDQMKIMK
jgi:hypothetical protein